jgi:hypothetical protein
MDIQNSFEKIKDAVQELEYEEGFSFDVLNARLCKTVSDTVNTAFKTKIQTLLNDDQVGSHLYYKDALKSIENFAGGGGFYLKVLLLIGCVNMKSIYLAMAEVTQRLACIAGLFAVLCNEGRKAGIIKENQYSFGNEKYEIPTG